MGKFVSFEFKGLDELKTRLDSKNLQKKLIPGIGIAVLQLHNGLRTAIIDRYTTGKDLNSVLIGKSTSQLKQGTNFIETQLQYKNVPLRLAEFPTNIYSVNVKPRLIQFEDGGKGITDKAQVVQVKIKRSGGFKTVVGKLGYGGFLQKTNGLRNIFERQQEATWIVRPSLRAKIKPLFGPSLADMASYVYQSDPKVQQIKNNLHLELEKFLNL